MRNEATPSDESANDRDVVRWSVAQPNVVELNVKKLGCFGRGSNPRPSRILR